MSIYSSGIARGISEGKIEDILDFLSDLGTVPEPLEKRIRSESDLDVLRAWLKKAARVQSIEQFMQETACMEPEG